MKLQINHKCSREFILYICNIIRAYILTNIDYEQVKGIETIINLDTSKLLFGTKFVSIKSLIISATQNLRIQKVNNSYYVIDINPNVVVPNTKLKLLDVCKLINYGNLLCKGYPIFTCAFNNIKNNYNAIYNSYLIGKRDVRLFI